ncbi:radical SAM protein, partial [Candidatus Hakubella thermalkaliphila]|uniref:radical SAM protein n=1 Tax=Candidatus Hakubella thermalkaliphila TaxID=2754717 RepID=UPI001593C489
MSTATKSRFFRKIQDGCNYSCSYCTIPKARGASKSIIPDTVVRQAVEAVSSGYKEIVLTGIHLGAYGLDLKPKVKLSKLIETILKQPTITRIRLSSLEIREIDDGLPDLLTDKSICNHLHIPLQRGDDSILKLMNRIYNSGQFSFKINDIAKKIPGISIGTDV